MGLLSVYTREDFIYEDKIKVSLIGDKISENICYLECKRRGKVIFVIVVKSSIYHNLGVDALIEMQFRLYGISAKLLYSEKRFTYILQPTIPFHTVDFVICGDKNLCAVTYTINNSAFSKSMYLFADYSNLLMLRYFTDSLFWSILQSKVEIKKK